MRVVLVGGGNPELMRSLVAALAASKALNVDRMLVVNNLEDRLADEGEMLDILKAFNERSLQGCVGEEVERNIKLLDLASVCGRTSRDFLEHHILNNTFANYHDSVTIGAHKPEPYAFPVNKKHLAKVQRRNFANNKCQLGRKR